MTNLRCVVGVVLLTTAIDSASANPDIEMWDAQCLGTVQGRCSLEYKLPGQGEVAVQTLSPETKGWVSLGQVTEVDTGHFYRVQRCDINSRCDTSNVFWAPILIPAEAIPQKVYIRYGTGKEEAWNVGDELPHVYRLSKFNLYKSMDMLGRTVGADLGEMTIPPPLEDCDNHPTFDHAEVHILNAVYSEYVKQRAIIQAHADRLE